jgi:hypothetical protein
MYDKKLFCFFNRKGQLKRFNCILILNLLQKKLAELCTQFLESSFESKSQNYAYASAVSGAVNDMLSQDEDALPLRKPLFFGINIIYNFRHSGNLATGLKNLPKLI